MVVVGGVMAAVVLGGAAAAGVSIAQSGPVGIEAPPAFTPAQSQAYAGDDWINAQGGDVEGDRYSTLTSINQTNVGTLKQAWVTDLGLCPSHTATCGSEEASPAEYAGTLYIQTPRNGIYALSATTGQVLWNFNPPYAAWDPGFQPGSGGRQPGVTVANGLVFAGFADGSLVALNAQTGQLAWRTIVGPWQEGVRLSSAPVYYDGIIYEPTAGGDGGS
jgi:glucose dehydrogenase